MQWLEICVETDGEPDVLCAELEALGVEGLVIEDEADFARFLEQGRAYWDYVDQSLVEQMRGKRRVKFYLADDAAGQAREQALRAQLETRGYTVSLRRVQDEDWENNWKQYYRPIPVGQRLYIVPEWETAADAGTRTIIRLNPGLIFGTGSHPTTRMCLEALEPLAGDCDWVLDLGCGSGVLAIAALLLGAGQAVGCDIDPKARDVALENAAYNGITPPQLEVLCGDLVTDTALRAQLAVRKYPLILANIVADVILSLSRSAAALLTPGGHFICSGILDGREAEVAAGLREAGLRITAHRQLEDWHCFTAVPVTAPEVSC